MKIIEGGVTAAKGFEAAATAAGIKYQGRTDMAIIYSVFSTFLYLLHVFLHFSDYFF